MELYFKGLIVGAFTFTLIGVLHPIVIKTEYHFGVKAWRAFLLAGVAALAAALLVEDTVVSSMLGVTAFSSFWSIKELFAQRRRVQKNWFPKNPKRKY